MATPFAFVTLVTSDYYLPGALALVAALKDLHPTPPTPPEVDFQTLCLVTPETVDVSTIKLLRKAFDAVVGVEVIDQRDSRGLQLLGRPDLNHVLTKLHVFRLTQFSKVVFLDADVLPIQPMSHLFDTPHEFAAVPDVGWPDIFNSGVLVLSPGEDKFNDLLELLKSRGSWDGGDQGLLNEWRGQDWHRLSFTYNTTPTAAYTYAPAYERFGSQIRAIHFIGPNKPWSSIMTRPPGTKTGQPSTSGVSSELQAMSAERSQPIVAAAQEKQQAYDYGSLLDRWYDVYDTHYRSEASITHTDFEVRHYASAWDDGQNYGADVFQVPAAPGTGGALGLEDLRKIALEGMSNFPSNAEERPSEGEYRSLPLEGRVDLMRPRREPSPEQHHQEHQPGEEQEGHSANVTPRQEYWSLPEEPSRMDTLPTPGPNEVPPAPWLHGHSLPPTPGYFPQEQHSKGAHQQWDRPDQHQAQYHEPPQHPQDSPQADRQHEQTQHTVPAEHHPPHPESIHHHHEHHPPHGEQGTHHPHHHHHREHHEHHYEHERPRPPSPPKLSWNPALEPPPNDPPVSSAFPSDTYFPNVWDQVPGQQHDATHQFQPTNTGAPESDVFFRPPPPSHIPEQLIREGQYANVIGHHPEAHHGRPRPDRMKVHTIFPWEDKPRQAPQRVFPQSDFPPPGAQYVVEAKPPSPPPVKPPSPVQPPLLVHTPSPSQGLPFNFTYSNAWDSVPSIQRYASRLVRPPYVGFHSSPTVATPDDGWKRWEKERERDVQAKQDASSMDGDDEDEGDEDDEDRSGVRWVDSESSRERPAPRSRASSTTSIISSTKGKKYKTRGTQTSAPQMRSQGVQVKMYSDESDGFEGESMHRRRGSKSSHVGLAARRDLPVPSATGILPHTTLHSLKLEPELMASATPTVSHSLKAVLPFPSKASPTGLRSPQTLGSPRTYSPPKLMSPPKAPSPPKSGSPRKLSSGQASRRGSGGGTPAKPASPVVSSTSPPTSSSPKLPRISSFSPPLARTSSNDTALTSSTSTQGTVATPLDTTPTSTIRKGGRVWDPSRSVDVFKRGSEEVLARFLRMGTFDEEERRSGQ
ncbi:glycosyltransferase family 8 protein [Gelatoporia subvermispora B]|uniref:Glycosyltransferase family 8 protein n=1 Tax=Ceriporiopsis subvermispora (strain B) TaxID=914234 RepID=M2RTY0_CERS8|nr:glycosyltransferase family 8 protein [Gelatoporia subvermispora B]